MCYGTYCRLWPVFGLDVTKIGNSLSTFPLLNGKYLDYVYIQLLPSDVK